MNLAYLPSPTRNVWDLGPIPIRAYAVCIILGVIAAVAIGERRWVARGGQRGTVTDIAIWAVPFGLIGARIYHVVTDSELYFSNGADWVDAFRIWDGGLGIWGAIAGGTLGAWLGLRLRGVRLAPFADAAAPGIAVAQAIGRLGNWFNNELYGKPTTQPWGLTIHDIDPDTHRSTGVIGHYQPTFLYELVWNLGTAGVVIWADRKFQLGRGRAFALYVMAYTAGRVWIEMLRIDHAPGQEPHEFLGLRLNVWTSIVVFAAALAYFLLRRGPRETVVQGTGAVTTEPETAQKPADEPSDAEAPDAPADAEDTVDSEDTVIEESERQQER